MSKSISKEFKEQLKINDTNFIGVELAKICVKYNFQIVDLAKTFSVSRMTIHNWFRDGYVRRLNFLKIKEFLDLINSLPLNVQEEIRTLPQVKKLFLIDFLSKTHKLKVIKPDTKKRLYFRLSIFELETIAENRQPHEDMSDITFELSFRKSPRAKLLLKNISKAKSDSRLGAQILINKAIEGFTGEEDEYIKSINW